MKTSVFVLAAAGLLVGAGATGSAAKVTVSVILDNYAADRNWEAEMVKNFEASHPDIVIKLIDYGSAGLVGKMQAMVAAGTPPDIGYMDPYLIVDWAKSGVAANLTPYIKQAGSQYDDWYASAWNLYRVDGNVYGLPKDLQLGAIYYNKDHYDAAGLSYPSPDWTYDDLLQNAKRLTVVGADNQVTRYGFRLPTSRNWAPLVWAYGGDLLDSWTQPTRFTGDSDQVAAALQYLHDLVQLKAVQDKATFESVGTTAAFMSQKVSMLLTNSVVMADFGAIKDFAWDVAPFPQGPAGAVPYINAIGWFMFKGSAHPEASWEVLRYFTSQEALRRRVAVIGNIPPSRQVILDSWLPSRAQPAGRALLLNHIEQARSPWMLDERVFDPMNKEVLAAIWGEKSVQNAIQTMKQEVTGILAED